VTIHTNGDPHWRAVEFAAGLIVGCAALSAGVRSLAPFIGSHLLLIIRRGSQAYESLFWTAPVEQECRYHDADLFYRWEATGRPRPARMWPSILSRCWSSDWPLWRRLNGLGIHGWRCKVRRHLVETEAEPTRWPALRVALNVSPRSSAASPEQAEGRSFQDVLDDMSARVGAAVAVGPAGQHARCNMTELALILGFSSSSAFSRAFPALV
jgi:AraC-like DNA-binding protein